MSKPKRLAWGETPWDKLSREELLREVQRMYSALIASRSVLRMERLGEENHPFWSIDGIGGDALAMASDVIETIHAEWNSESIYRSFFRVADDLLFGDSVRKDGWKVCPKGHMQAPARDGQCVDCKQPMRPLEWDDLKVAK